MQCPGEMQCIPACAQLVLHTCDDKVLRTELEQTMYCLAVISESTVQVATGLVPVGHERSPAVNPSVDSCMLWLVAAYLPSHDIGPWSFSKEATSPAELGHNITS